jgi:CubicO group peptidase (beta-lactamase class C family)
MHPDLREDRDKRLGRMECWRLTWEPDSRFEYHATAAHWTIAEIITQRTGLDFRDYVRQRLTEPMGVPELFVGLPDEFHSRAADVVYTVPPVMPEDGWKETNPDTVLHFNLPSQRRAGCPGAGAFAGAGELALFYQRLVRPEESGAHAPLKPSTIEFATEVRTRAHHVDGASGLPVNRALAVVVAGDEPLERGFAPTASPQAFGHGGAGGQLAWGDPETGLSVGFVTNGFVPADELTARSREINRLAGECVAG